MIPWDFIGPHGISSDFIRFHRIPWDSIGFHRVPQDSMRIYRDPQESIGPLGWPRHHLVIMRELCGNYAGLQSYKFYRNLCHFYGNPIGIQMHPQEFQKNLQQLYRNPKGYYRFNAELAEVYRTHENSSRNPQGSIGIHSHSGGRNMIQKLYGSYAGSMRDCRSTSSIEIYVISMGIQLESKQIHRNSTGTYNNCIGIQRDTTDSTTSWQKSIEPIGIPIGIHRNPQESNRNKGIHRNPQGYTGIHTNSLGLNKNPQDFVGINIKNKGIHRDPARN